MQLMDLGRYFDIIVPEEIKKLINIDINAPEYKETCCSVNSIKRTNEICAVYSGDIMIKREGFPLYILGYTYEVNENDESCNLKIHEIFYEFLDYYNIPHSAY